MKIGPINELVSILNPMINSSLARRAPVVELAQYIYHFTQMQKMKTFKNIQNLAETDPDDK